MKYILIGDTHFGVKSFNLDFFENQINFFNQQVFPYMEENKIDTIIQTGDLLDNRTVMDINFFNLLCTNFFDVLQEKGFKLITILGNHDIYYKSSRETNLIKYIDKLYDNITLISEQTSLTLGNTETLLVPWLLEGEHINHFNEEIIIGHFEIQNFQLSRGSFDTKSELTDKSFKNVKKVYSGHYHINQENKNIHYVGTPYQINWGDFGNKCGFYVIDKDYEKFILNETSNIHVKITWDEKNQLPMSYNLLDQKIDCSLEDFKKILKNNFIIKVENVYSKNNTFEELLFLLKESGIKYTFINSQEIESIINPDNIKVNEMKLKGTDTFVLDYVKDNHPELVTLIEEILKDVVYE